MNPDILRWNEKYRAASRGAFGEPDPLLTQHAALLEKGKRALDLACGAGANAIFAATRGMSVVGVDASLEGLRIASKRARAAGVRIALVNADLEVYRPPAGRFDLVLMFRYLNRPLIASLAAALRPGGVMMCKTFNLNYLEDKPDMNPDYLLEPGELHRSFPGLVCIDSNDGEDNAATTSWWIGRKP